MTILTQTRRLAAAALVAGTLLGGATGALAFERVYTDDDVAIRGYDPVAYFTEGRPVEGEESFRAEHDGAVWHFASAANRDAFVAAPESYAPQYGGYCAYAVSEGYTASIDPDAWRVVDGKLYLNYSKSIQRRWEKNSSERIVIGDRNWPLIVANEGRLN